MTRDRAATLAAEATVEDQGNTTPGRDPAWGLANQRYLAASLRLLACRLAQRGGHERIEPSPGRHAGGAVGPEQRSEGRSENNDRIAAERDVAEAGAALPAASALDALQAIFGLTTFERELVLLCAGCELDTELAERHGP